MKANNFWDDLTGISVKKEALVLKTCLYVRSGYTIQTRSMLPGTQFDRSCLDTSYVRKGFHTLVEQCGVRIRCSRCTSVHKTNISDTCLMCRRWTQNMNGKNMHVKQGDQWYHAKACVLAERCAVRIRCSRRTSAWATTTHTHPLLSCGTCSRTLAGTHSTHLIRQRSLRAG